MRHPIHVLDAQALPWELGSEDGQLGLSLASSSGRSLCMRAAGLQTFLHFSLDTVWDLRYIFAA